MRWYSVYNFEVEVHQILIELSLFLKLFQTCLGFQIILPTVLLNEVDETWWTVRLWGGTAHICFEAKVHKLC